MGGIDLEQLPRLPLDSLRRLWTEHVGGTPPSLRRLLVRELAWRAQSRAHGGLDAETKSLLEAAMRAARHVRPVPHSEADALRSGGRTAKSRAPKSRTELPAAARLIRVWRGVSYEVVVVGKHQYRYRGRVYPSLTEIAIEITGSVRSGPGFFGLTTRPPRKKASATRRAAGEGGA